MQLQDTLCGIDVMTESTITPTSYPTLTPFQETCCSSQIIIEEPYYKVRPSRAIGSINSLQSPSPRCIPKVSIKQDRVHLSVLLFDYKIVYIEVSLTVSKKRSYILRYISHIRHHSRRNSLATCHRCTLSSCGNMKGCTVVSFMEEKLSIFRNILTFYVDVDTAAQSLGETIFSEGPLCKT